MSQIALRQALLDETLIRLRAGAGPGTERVALWLAPASSTGVSRIVELHEPEQDVSVDRFYLPPHSLRALLARLRQGRLKIAAQIHTHPGRAFHSDADAEWAIVRHVGALSLVLPRFAIKTTVATFFDEVKTYELSGANEWELTPNQGPAARVLVMP